MSFVLVKQTVDSRTKCVQDNYHSDHTLCEEIANPSLIERGSCIGRWICAIDQGSGSDRR